MEVRPLNYGHVPSCTYCDPEIGSVGLTEAQAKERGYDVRVGSFPFGLLTACKEHDKLHWHDIAAKLAGMAGARRNGAPTESSTSDS